MRLASRLSAGEDPAAARNPRARLLAACIAAGTLALSGCVGLHRTVEPTEGHVKIAPAPPGEILPPVRSSTFAVPVPKPTLKPPTYSVVVNDVPVKELLVALARDTRQNIDIHPGLTGLVSLNAINETLPAILERISKQVNMRVRYEGNTILVQPDTPYLKTYRVNYVNMERDSESRIGVSGSITGGPSTSGGGQGGAQGTNQSQTTVNTKSQNHFWTVLRENIRNILASTQALAQSAEDKAARSEALRAARDERIAQAEAVARAGAAAPSMLDKVIENTPPRDIPGDVNQSIVVNPIAGTVSVLATERQHDLIRQHIDSVLNAVHRQVLIEATIVEVRLSDAYQAGIDWSRLPITGGLSLTQSLLSGFGTGLTQGGDNQFRVGYVNPDSGIGNISATVRLLEEFGNTRVLSSPKLMAMNNQTALLKVVDNVVYFEISSSVNQVADAGTVTAVTTTAKTVSVGVVMGVTPQINENGRVTLTVRPSVSRVLRFVPDPNPVLEVQNLVPEVQIREMESVLQVGTGQTVVLGGLMEDDIRHNREQIPGADYLGGVGELFRFRDNRNIKRELVIFLKPTIVTNPSLQSDELQFYQRFLPQMMRAPAGTPAAPATP
ncbi:MAG: Type II secretory pathway component PulD [Betaproteobacteria bacterium]|nr:Type II secretory pathway component PulD [Betaproteobacteria bacterium]